MRGLQWGSSILFSHLFIRRKHEETTVEFKNYFLTIVKLLYAGDGLILNRPLEETTEANNVLRE